MTPEKSSQEPDCKKGDSQSPNTPFHVCWTIDCESCHPDINNPDLGRKAIRGFAQILNELDWKGTFFAIPEEIAPLSDDFGSVVAQGHELALHTHPKASGCSTDFLGEYSSKHQARIIRRGLAELRTHLGVDAVSVRPGYCSANDSTFPVMSECGIRQSSASMPGRVMSQLASNWAGAPLFAHYTHPYNRLLSGSMDLVEIPISVDWESMIWGGHHPQDLRVEFTDAKNHSFLIRKVMQRQVEEKLPFRALVVLTHNLFKYADATDFRRETMCGIIDSIRKYAEELGVQAIGSTIAEAGRAFRTAVPLAAESS